MEAPFVLDGRAVAEARVPAQRIVEALDVSKAGHASLGLRCKRTPAEQFAFQGREEALGHGVVVGVFDRSYGWPDTGFFAPAAEGERCVLASQVGVVDHVSRKRIRRNYPGGSELG